MTLFKTHSNDKVWIMIGGVDGECSSLIHWSRCFNQTSFFVVSFLLCQTVKRPRKVAVHSLKPPPSPGSDSRDYSPSTHYYDADNDNGWYESRDHTSDSKTFLGPDYNQRVRSRGRSQERSSPSPDRSRREGSRGRALDTSVDRQKHRGRGGSPADSYRLEDKYERGEGGGGRGGRYRSRDQLHDDPPSPEPSRELEPLEKPVNVLLVKNRPNEGTAHHIIIVN